MSNNNDSQVMADVYDKMVLQCLKSISEHNAYHLVYETSATPLSLLFSLFKYREDSFFIPFLQFFQSIQNTEVAEKMIVSVARVSED